MPLIDQKISTVNVILIFIAVLAVIVFFAFLKKLYYRIFYKIRYYIIPRTQIKGIANIAMIISVTVSIIFLLTILSANGLGIVFRAYVGSRILIESFLIKIGGMLFGPLIGLFIGAITDLLTVVLTSGTFHYGYFVSAMAYGLVAGILKSLMIHSKQKNFNFAFLSTLVIVIIMIGTYFFIQLQPQEMFNIELLVSLPPIPKYIFTWMLMGFLGLAILVIWIFYGVTWLKPKPIKPHFVVIPSYGRVNTTIVGHNQIKVNSFVVFVSALMVSIMTQYCIDLFMLPYFDESLSALTFDYWFTFRSLVLIPHVILSTFMIFIVYKIISPLIKYEYVKDMYEKQSVRYQND